MRASRRSWNFLHLVVTLAPLQESVHLGVLLVNMKEDNKSAR